MEPVGSFIAGELLTAVKDVAMKNFEFNNCRQNLQRTLEGLIPLLEGVAYNLLSDDQQKPFKKFYVELQTGKTLLQKCSKVSQFNFWRIYKYAKEIERFDYDIVKFTQIIGWALNLREIHEINNGRANLDAKVDEMREILQRMMKDHRDPLGKGESGSPSSIPKLSDCSDGLEISVGELKKPLLSEDVQLLGELETAFRNDKEFQGMIKQNPALQYDVFINHRGTDVKNSLASFIYHQLKIKKPNLRVFLDTNEIPYGVDFELAIETAIQSSSVHIAIFSERYAESKWCLHELDLIIKSRRKLIPVFYDIDPAALRRIEEGCYQKAFEKHRTREPLENTKRWEDALARASYLEGLPFKMKETDHWEFVQKIVSIVLMNLKEGSSVDDKYPVAPAHTNFGGMMKQNPALQYDVFINHNGTEVKNSVASFIYHQLKTEDPNLRVFLNKNDIPYGVDFELAIETAIQSSSVHIAIFSERYAESKWCLHELDLIIKSRRKLIPVFCDIDPPALRRIEKGCYQKAFEKHRGTEPLEKTKRWEDALARASYFQGLPFKKKESDCWEFVEKIVSIVLMNLKEGSSVDDKYPVAPAQAVEEFPVKNS